MAAMVMFEKTSYSNRVSLLAFVMIACLSMLIMGSSLAMAQSQSKPMNLGTILQKQTKGAPPPRTYLKLPKEIPAPKPKAAGASSASSDQPSPTQPQQTAPQEQVQKPADGSNTAQGTPAATINQAASQPMVAKPQAPQIEPGGIARLQLAAFLTQNGQPLQRGLNWRIFEEKKDEQGRMPMVQNSMGGALEADLPPGRYIVYAGYGYANLTKRIILAKAGDYSESFVLHAGGLRLNAVAAGDVNLDANLLRFNIYTKPDAEGSQQLIAPNIRSKQVVKLTEGTYHIVSVYGDANAKVRGDVEVKAGDLVTVTMIHNAAKVTLRLVSEPGGEALANTVWTVLTPGGDLVKRAIGAFPTLALAAGDYTAIAKQGEEIYNRDFSVDAGLDRDIEVLAAKAQ